jgi:hypothetical protein
VSLKEGREKEEERGQGNTLGKGRGTIKCQVEDTDSRTSTEYREQKVPFYIRQFFFIWIRYFQLTTLSCVETSKENV